MTKYADAMTAIVHISIKWNKILGNKYLVISADVLQGELKTGYSVTSAENYMSNFSWKTLTMEKLYCREQEYRNMLIKTKGNKLLTHDICAKLTQ